MLLSGTLYRECMHERQAAGEISRCDRPIDWTARQATIKLKCEPSAPLGHGAYGEAEGRRTDENDVAVLQSLAQHPPSVHDHAIRAV